MGKHSIHLTSKNDNWLESKLASHEYSSKSEFINHLINEARERDYIRSRLTRAEKSGLTSLTPDEILLEAKNFR